MARVPVAGRRAAAVALAAGLALLLLLPPPSAAGPSPARGPREQGATALSRERADPVPSPSVAAPSDHITWSNVSSSPSPAGRDSAAMAFDAAAQELLLFGGAVPGAPGPAGDTWAYGLGSWRELCSGTASAPACPVDPPASVRGAMAYDAGQGRMVYYDWGLGLTFSFANGSWSNLSGGPHPARQSIPSQIAFDAQLGAVVALDGGGTLWGFLRDNWTALHWVGPGPPARVGAQLYADPATRGIVVFGGVTGDVAWHDMWSFSNASWSELSATVPSVGIEATAYDAGFGYEALLGVTGGTLSLWAFADGAWQVLPLDPGAPPPPALGPAFGFDGADGTLLLFSGLLSGPSGTYALPTTYAPVDELVALNLTLSRTAAVQGDTFRIHPVAKGGVLPYSYTYTQLVPGCAGVNLPSIACEARTVGTYPLAAFVGDGRWGSVRVATNITVVPIPTDSIAATPNPTTVGIPVTLRATVVGGLPPFVDDWAFGDGSTGVGAAVNHTFALAGTYNVTLTARNESGVPTVAELLLFVDPAPRITTFSASPNVTDQHVPVQFSGAATGGTTPLAYNWTFGDGIGRALGPVATYSYALPGSYTVSFWANDSLGATTLATRVEQINPSPSAVILATPALYNTSVDFGVGLSGGTAPFEFVWQLGDGQVAVAPAVTHVYPAPGYYTVTLTVRDAAGWTTVDTLNVSVHPGAPPPPATPWYEGGTGLDVLGLLLLGIGGGALALIVRTYRSGREPPTEGEAESTTVAPPEEPAGPAGEPA